ncbi:unnamed protein product, partial [marine sediment metagenome]
TYATPMPIEYITSILRFLFFRERYAALNMG